MTVDVHENLVKVQNALLGCMQSLEPFEDAAATMGMDSLATVLSTARRQLQAQRRLLGETDLAYVTEKLATANAASYNVLQSALAGIEVASRET
jgi:hypothetical protein